MAPIYSQQLVNAAYAGAFSGGVYTVPAGTSVVVTNIDTYLDSSVAGQSSFVILGAIALLYTSSAAAGIVNQQWVGKQVLKPGDVITWITAHTNSRLAISAYVLGP